jgi:hypothetical protein
MGPVTPSDHAATLGTGATRRGGPQAHWLPALQAGAEDRWYLMNVLPVVTAAVGGVPAHWPDGYHLAPDYRVACLLIAAVCLAVAGVYLKRALAPIRVLVRAVAAAAVATTAAGAAFVFLAAAAIGGL